LCHDSLSSKHPGIIISDYFGLLHVLPSNPTWNHFIMSGTRKTNIFFFSTSLLVRCCRLKHFSLFQFCTLLFHQEHASCFDARFPQHQSVCCTAYATGLGVKTNCPHLHGIPDSTEESVVVQLLLSLMALLWTCQKRYTAQCKK
jgi:hypothetical protein